MKVISEAVSGRILEGNGRNAILILENGDDTSVVYLAYALVTLGPEEHVLPSTVLDDWGKEMSGLEVYEWIRENGNHFPRAEIFAAGIDGEERQQFLREFELYASYPVYALPTRNSPVTNSVRISAMLIPDESVTVPTPVKRPSSVKGPMALARVSWWHVPPGQHDLGFLESRTEAT